MVRQCVAQLAIVIAGCVCWPAMAAAQTGAIGFPLDPARSVIRAGEAFSWLEKGLDWDAMSTQTLDLVEYANPSLDQEIRIESWRTSTALRFIFLVQDRTRRQAGTNNTLEIGDKIIIQIDPNNSRDMTLQPGTAGTPLSSDHRFEIVFKNGALTDHRHKTPTAGGNWPPGSTSPQMSVAPVVTAPAFSTVLNVADVYTIDVTIPFAEIGTPNFDTGLGIAIAFVNDLGHGHTDDDGVVTDVTGSEFPSGMGLDEPSDPGLADFIAGAVTSGNWRIPSQWALGYFGTAATDVTFTHDPDWVISKAIRMSRCNVTSYNGVGEVSWSNWGQQTSITGWYQYNPINPCDMKLWFRMDKTGVAAARRRLLVVWGRPGIAPKDWYFITVTPPISVTSAQQVVDIVWPNPPAVTFTEHPCLRVYLLPETLKPGFEEKDLALIDTQAELVAMENAYLVFAGDQHTAQMNFTAVHPGTSCTTAGCTNPPGPSPDDADAHNLVSGGPSADSLTDFQPPPQPALRVPVDRSEAAFWNQPMTFVRAKGVAVSRIPKRRYTILSRAGAVAWVVPTSYAQQGYTLKFSVGAPDIIARTVVKGEVRVIRAPARPVMLHFDTVNNEKVPWWSRLFGRRAFVPRLKVDYTPRIIEPGQVTPAVLSLSR